MREFSFQSTVEEVKINDIVYVIDFSDEKVKEYQKTFREFYDKAMSIKSDTDKPKTEEEEEKLFEQSKELTRDTINALLGKGKFEIIYNQSGKSLMNVLELVGFLGEIVREKAEKLADSHVNKYLANKQQPQQPNKNGHNNKNRPNKNNVKFNK